MTGSPTGSPHLLGTARRPSGSCGCICSGVHILEDKGTVNSLTSRPFSLFAFAESRPDREFPCAGRTRRGRWRSSIGSGFQGRRVRLYAISPDRVSRPLSRLKPRWQRLTDNRLSVHQLQRALMRILRKHRTLPFQLVHCVVDPIQQGFASRRRMEADDAQKRESGTAASEGPGGRASPGRCVTRPSMCRQLLHFRQIIAR